MNRARVVGRGSTGAALLFACMSSLAAQVVIPAGASVLLPSGSVGLACADLTVQGTMAVGASQVGMARNVTIASGATLDAGAGTLTVGGNWTNGGTFARGTSTVTFADGCATTAAVLSGTTAFTNLAFTSAGGRTFVLPAGGATSVMGALTLSGAPGLPIQIVSATPSQPTFIALGAGATVSSANVQLGANVTIGAPCNALGPGDCDGDGIPNAVEATEGRNPQVKDNDVFASNRLFAMQQYRDFLGREGDAGGITFYTDLLTTGPAVRANVIESFFNSPEFSGTVSPVVRLYFATFLRIPDYGGLQFQVDAYRTGTPLTVVANNFSASPEFQSRYGALTNAQYVTLLYQNVLARTPVQAEVDYHVARLVSGVTRGEVMVGFSESPEFQAGTFNEVYVTMMYVGMLGRAPEQAGFDFWVTYMDSGNPGINLILGFLNAPEYRNRFLP
jgi:hypothetical protein